MDLFLHVKFEVFLVKPSQRSCKFIQLSLNDITYQQLEVTRYFLEFSDPYRTRENIKYQECRISQPLSIIKFIVGPIFGPNDILMFFLG